MERNRNGHKGLKLGIILAAVAGIFVAVLAAGGPSAYADPGRTSACDSCHGYPASALNVTTDITSKTVSPGGSFVVNVSWTGGGTGGATNEINWPYTLNNTLFSPSPRIPYSGSASSGSTSSTLTAPATPGTYTVRVYGATGSGFQTDYQNISITVSAPPDTTGPVTAGVSASPSPTAGAASVTLTASVGDTSTGGSNITAAEYFMDTVGADGGGTAMTASDGSFNSARERVRASIDVAGLPAGSHTLYIRGQDAAGNWGPTSSVSIKVRPATGGDRRHGDRDDDDDDEHEEDGDDDEEDDRDEDDDEDDD